MLERTSTCRACGRPIQLRAVIVPPEAVQTIRREDAIRSLEAAAARWRRAKAAERELEYEVAEVARVGAEGQ